MFVHYTQTNHLFILQASIHLEYTLSVCSLHDKSINFAAVSSYFPGLWPEISNNTLFRPVHHSGFSLRKYSSRLAQPYAFALSMDVLRRP